MQEAKEPRKLNIDDTLYETEIPDSYGKTWKPEDRRRIKAFIPGTVVEVKTSVGTKVSNGDILLILDAMKMYNEITTPVTGIIAEIAVTAGERVEKNQLLIRLE
ncbi:MAG: acetyl-CoA carboxylase biotin carboxyl carrier protein subunit [bacterium]|nr:acetyl-CoA carboxylase biotin carboxyl carrier protein subunit [bacterium]